MGVRVRIKLLWCVVGGAGSKLRVGEMSSVTNYGGVLCFAFEDRKSPCRCDMGRGLGLPGLGAFHAHPVKSGRGGGLVWRDWRAN